jgi:hypothetical protein
MAHEREVVAAAPLPANEASADARWPVPYAILFITVVSVTLWSLIIVAAELLLG